MKKFLLIACSCLLCAISAHAEAPLPPKKNSSLSDLKEKVETEKEKQKELEKKAESLEKDLDSIKTSLVKTVRDVQKSEAALQRLDAELADLKAKKFELSKTLEKDRASLSSLILALERIRRLPPETLVARPGAPLETAQAATVLGAILPDLNRRATDLRQKLEDMASLEEELADNQVEAKAAHERLKAETSKMNAQMASRSKLFARTREDAKVQQQAVAAAAREAANFEELIRRIEERNRELEKQAKSAPPKQPGGKRKPSPDENKLASTLPSLGPGQLPVSGIVRVRYGEEDDIGAVSQGIRIESRPGAVVVAPLGGVVRYAGEFKSYGNIILLEHKNNYHSLIAGLGRIDTVVGQSVGSGEPVGSLGSQDSSRPTVYYELRLNGQPIDPARKFSDLGT